MYHGVVNALVFVKRSRRADLSSCEYSVREQDRTSNKLERRDDTAASDGQQRTATKGGEQETVGVIGGVVRSDVLLVSFLT